MKIDCDYSYRLLIGRFREAVRNSFIHGKMIYIKLAKKDNHVQTGICQENGMPLV